MDMELALREYGLSDKEIQVYLALLSLTDSKLQQIAKGVKLPRTTVYNTLNYLASKGLVSKITKKKVTYFSAADPERLRDKLEEKKRIIESVLPNLKVLQKSVRQSSSVEIFEGFDGVYTILSDVFKKKQSTYYFGSYLSSLNILKHLPSHARIIRLENSIPAQVVIEPADEEMFHSEKYKQLTDMRFCASLAEFPAMIFIYGDKVAMYTVKGNLVGVIMQNKEFAEAMKMIFKIYWDIGKPAEL